MIEVVAWSVDHVGTKGEAVRAIVVASRHGILRAEFGTDIFGKQTIQSEFEKATWSRDPSKTTSLLLWEHSYVTAIHRHYGKRGVKQHDIAQAGGMFDDLGLRSVIMTRTPDARKLWQHWWWLECGEGTHVEPYYEWPDEFTPRASFGTKRQDLHDLLSEGPVDHYANDTTYGIF